ncbi:MAG: peptidylprolyl isomerase [Vicinamibacteria bacterium]
MKRPFVLFVVLSMGAFVPSSCSSQEESTTDSAAASLLEPGPSSPAVSTQAAADLGAMPEVVAKVNDTEITKAELLARAESIQGRLPAGTGRDSLDFYRRVLDDLISSELLYQSSAARGFVPTEAEVDAQMAQIRSQFPDEAQFDQALAAQGLNEEELRGMTTRSLGVQAMISKGIEITAEQKQTFYQQNLERMKEPEQVRLSHILVSADENATPEQRDQAKKKTEDIRARALAGEDFATLARENSDDPGSKANGGELPWVGPGDTVPPFEAAAFALAPGQISEVVETRYGYHVIKLAERKEGGVVTFEQAEPRIEQVLRDRAIQERLRTEIEALKAAGNIEVFI